MEMPPEQHTGSVLGAVTIKQEPVEAEPLVSPKQEIEYITVKEEGTPCKQEWEVLDGHSNTQDPLSIVKEECSPLEPLPGPSTSNIDKTEDEQYEEEPGSEDDMEVKHEVESSSVSSEAESTILVGVENDAGTDDSGGLVTKREAFCVNKSGKKQLVYYWCNICKMTFSRLQDLKQHTHAVHLEDRLSCSVCHKTFSTSYDLKTHFSLHTDDRSYWCGICNKTLKSKILLKHHFWLHGGKLPYSCDICNKKFTTSGTLKQHSLIHTEDRPYSCIVCQKRFKCSRDLSCHLRMHTGKPTLQM